MATNATPFPRLPTPPQQTNTQYVEDERTTARQLLELQNFSVDLVRALETFLTQAQNPQLNFQEIKEMGSASVLNSGDMYIADGGSLKIVQTDDIFANTNVGTTALGSVTVTVS